MSLKDALNLILKSRGDDDEYDKYSDEDIPLEKETMELVNKNNKNK